LALEISAVSNVSFAAAASRAVTALNTSASIPGITAAADSVFAPDGATAGRFVEVRAVLGRADSRTALQLAVTAGNGIVGALKDLRSGFELAASSLVNPSANLLDGNGSRVSVLNIQAQADILLNAIDSLVENAEVSGANLISSRSATVRLQTTAFGGAVDLQPQALDSAGLGLDAVNLLANGGVNAGLAAINKAITLAEQRLDRLESLQRATGDSTANRQFLAQALSGFGSATLQRGTLVDLIG